MGMPAAKQGDQVVATDTHVVLVPSPGGPVPTPVTLPFTGVLTTGLSPTVRIMGMPAATVGSVAINQPPHIPPPPGDPFDKPPTNQGTITTGSQSVLIDGKPAARAGDTALTCNDPVDQPVGKVVATGTVLIG
jgi:uncharacterized Zn-binding protein involved in type VI secretion